MNSFSPTNEVRPIRIDGWAKWPRYTESTLKQLEAVLSSGRWAISGPYAGTDLFEKAFAKAFADYCGVQYCVPCDHGSSALLIALEALDIGYGDEIIIPALTWVATATAIVNVNAIPVLADIDPQTLCMAPDKLESLITANTKAIMPVHLYSNMCDMEAICRIAEKHNIPVIEDCAHVHGAKWGKKYAGTIGRMGCFSLQQSKLLTAGEGGVVITDDPNLFERLQLLRADSRKYDEKRLERHEMEIKTLRKVQGTNFCMSEFQAAILIDQLSLLEQQNQIRHQNASYLMSLLENLPGIFFQQTDKNLSLRTYYCLPFKVDFEKYPDLDILSLQKLLKSLLTLPIERIYPCINNVESYYPGSKNRFAIHPNHQERLRLSDTKAPHAMEAYSSYLTFPHWVFLGTKQDMDDIYKAFATALKMLPT